MVKTALAQGVADGDKKCSEVLPNIVDFEGEGRRWRECYREFFMESIEASIESIESQKRNWGVGLHLTALLVLDFVTQISISPADITYQHSSTYINILMIIMVIIIINCDDHHSHQSQTIFTRMIHGHKSVHTLSLVIT